MTQRTARFWIFLALAIIVVSGGWLVLPLQTQPGVLASAWVEKGPVRLRLVAAHTAMKDGTAEIGLEMVLQPGWKTYWRFPGDSGIAPVLDWSASQNMRTARVAWPAPARFLLPGDTTFGYEGRVILPVFVQALVPTRPVKAALHLRYGVCADVCIPLETHVALTLPAGSALTMSSRVTPYADALAAFQDRVPVALPASLVVDCAWIAPDTVQVRLSGWLPVQPVPSVPPVPPVLIVEGPVSFALPQRGMDTAGRLVYTVSASSSGAPATGEEMSMPLRLTFLTRSGGFEVPGCAT